MLERRIIKICGLKDPRIVSGIDNIDFLGYVVGSQKSHRNIIFEKIIENENIVEDQRSVLVTVNKEIIGLVRESDLNINLQLHGSARNKFIEEQLSGLPEIMCNHPLALNCQCFENSEVIDCVDKKILGKIALGISANEFFGRCDPNLKQLVKPIMWDRDTNFLYLTIDTTRKDGYGGTGKSWKWKEIPKVNQTVLIAGGITPDNVLEALLTTKAHGIDVSSGVERMQVKDPYLIQMLIQKIF